MNPGAMSPTPAPIAGLASVDSRLSAGIAVGSSLGTAAGVGVRDGGGAAGASVGTGVRDGGAAGVSAGTGVRDGRAAGASVLIGWIGEGVFGAMSGVLSHPAATMRAIIPVKRILSMTSIYHTSAWGANTALGGTRGLPENWPRVAVAATASPFYY